MNSRTTEQFRSLFRTLPSDIREEGRKAYRLFKDNPRHPGLRFKKLVDNIWSARINQDYRVIGFVDDDEVVWFWVGKHAEYDKIVDQLRKR